MTDVRCITCGHRNHTTKDCTAPGGKKDPKWQGSWDEYCKRKAAANEAKGKGTGKGKGVGKGEDGKDKGKDDADVKGGGEKDGGTGKGKKGKDMAKAVVDPEAMRAASVRKKTVCPRDSLVWTVGQMCNSCI